MHVVDRNDRVGCLSPRRYTTQAEERLLVHLPVNVWLLLALHHGSKTSPSMPSALHLSPRFVVYSAGRTNRCGHPHRQVVRRFVWEQSQQSDIAVNDPIQWCSHRPGRIVTDRP